MAAVTKTKPLIKKREHNPLATLCDTVPQFNRDIPSFLLKQKTGGLTHEAYMNGAIWHHCGVNLLAYRTDQKPWCTQPRIHIVQLDDFLSPCSENFTLSTVSNKQGWRVDYTGRCNLGCKERAEDPRLVSVGKILYMFWTDGFKQYYGILDLTVEEGKLKGAKVLLQWTLKPPYIAELRTNKRYDGREKNWTPFSHRDQLWVVYCYDPFICGRVEGHTLTEIVRHDVNIAWDHGFIKGGTPARLQGKDYMTVFHSTIRDEAGINYYYAGALTFDAETLKPKQVSRYPMIAPYPDKDCHRPNDSYVIFPAGLMYDQKEKMWLTSYGYNDHSIKVHAFTEEELEYNLCPAITDKPPASGTRNKFCRLLGVHNRVPEEEDSEPDP